MLEGTEGLQPTVPAEPLPPVETPETPVVEPDKKDIRSVLERSFEEEEQRARDEQGRFVKEEKKPVEKQAVSVDKTPEIKPVKNPPSSWKKDMHDFFGKLDPTIQDYILEREGQYAKGVSTYKTEFDQLKPLGEAMRPFMPVLQQHGIQPDRWISSLGNAHLSLVQGSPEQKLSMFLKLAQDYQVPLQNLFTQQDGKVFYNPQIPQYQPPQAPQLDPQALKAEIMSEFEIKNFMNTSVDGKPAYPHFETVRETMAQLLEAGLADDLKGAYETAIRHPRHADIFTEIQQAEQSAKQAKEAEERRRAVETARRQQVSVKSGTPAKPNSGGKKGLREILEEQVEEKLFSAGRV